MNVLTLLSMQVALEYAQKKYTDFAAIVQPFFSNAKSDNFTVDFVSYVSLTAMHIMNAFTSYEYTSWIANSYTLPCYYGVSVMLFLLPLFQLDCFHPSVLAHQNMAKALWNNMLTPAARKKTSFDFTETFVCPTNSTLLYTY